MKEKNIKQKISNERGVTLIALIITIIIMIIIIGLSVDIGMDSLDSTRLQGFYMQLETIQKRADDIAITNEGYYIKNADGTRTYIDLKTSGGSALTSSQKSILQGILSSEGVGISPSEFRYFTVTNLAEQLDLKQMEYNVFIHFDTRTVIAENGITINGKTYYMLENNMFYTEQDTSKNQGILGLEYYITKYGTTNKYKITVTPSTVGDLTTNGTLKYKKTTTKYWETANGLEIIISELTDYDILYIDSNNNSVSESIKVYVQNGTPKITVYNYS